MLKKERRVKFEWVVAGVMIIIFILSFIFKNKLTEWVGGKYVDMMFTNSMTRVKLQESERVELERLRVENVTLKNQMNDIRKEINLMEDGLSPTYVEMLAKEMSFYGSFYVTYPKDKTVYKGMNIFSHGNVVVGQVEEVFPNSLFVSRLGQNKTFLAESADVKEQLELSSLGSGLYVGQMTGGSKISVGDSIVLKGSPKAVIGTVSEIAKGENTVSTIYVRAPYNIYEGEIFYVLQ